MEFAKIIRMNEKFYSDEVLYPIILKRVNELDKAASKATNKLVSLQEKLIGLRDWKSSSKIKDDVDLFVKTTKDLNKYEKNIEELFEKTYLEIARELWSNVELFSEGTEKQCKLNKKKMERILKLAIAEIINDYCNDELNEDIDMPPRQRDFDDECEIKDNLMDLLSGKDHVSVYSEIQDEQNEQDNIIEITNNEGSEDDNQIEAEKKTINYSEQEFQEFLKFKEFIDFKKDNKIQDLEEYFKQLIMANLKNESKKKIKRRKKKNTSNEEISMFDKPMSTFN